MGPEDQDREKASVAQAERELKALKAEKASLARELKEVRSLYKQLVEEAPLESFDERRVHLLKSQVIQLERQLLLMSNALTSRTEVLLLVENSILSVVDQLRELLASDAKGSSVAIQRSQLTDLIQTAEGARYRLYKNVESSNPEKLCSPLVYMGSFLKPCAVEDGVTLLDVCSGKMNHLNLKQVAKLESKLFSLQRQLQGLNQSLGSIWSREPHNCMQLFSHHLPVAVQQRLFGQLSQCQKSLADSCRDLLSLSILIPSAPWPLITRPVNCEPSLDSVMSALPSFPKSKQQQGRACIDALMKACTYSKKIAKLEAKAFADELHFHQSVYDVQMKYIKSVFTAVREAYDEFEQNTQVLLCQPLTKILEAYSSLASSSSEDTLKEFLSTFKAYANELGKVLDMFVIDSKFPSSGHEALSTYGKDFFDSVDALVQKCSLERDLLAKDIDAVRKMEEEHRQHGLKVFYRPKQGLKSASNDYQEAIQEEYISETFDSGSEPSHKNEDILNENNDTIDTGTITKSNVKILSPKPRSLKSESCKTVKQGTVIHVRKGPRVIGKLKGSGGLGDVLPEAIATSPLSTPIQKDGVREACSPTMASSRIPRSGSLSRLKPTAQHGPVSSKANEGHRHLTMAKSNVQDGYQSGTSNFRKSASEGSRLSCKASAAKPGS